MEKYYEFLQKIEEERIDITKLYILSCIGGTKADGEEWEKVEYCYDLWLGADVDLDLGRLADIVNMNWEKIQKDEMTDQDIIEECVNI